MEEILLRCIQCNKVCFLSEFDSLPEYEPTDDFMVFKEISKNDSEEFYRAHEGHEIERLRINKDTLVSSRSFVDTLKVSYFEATNGKEVFVIKRHRNNISDKMNYSLILGHISVIRIGLEINEKEIKRELEVDRSMKGLGKEQLDEFIKTLKDVISGLDPNDIEEINVTTEHPLKTVGRLKNSEIDILLNSCQKNFNEDEIGKIREFIARESYDLGSMAIVIKKSILIEGQKDNSPRL